MQQHTLKVFVKKKHIHEWLNVQIQLNSAESNATIWRKIEHKFKSSSRKTSNTRMIFHQNTPYTVHVLADIVLLKFRNMGACAYIKTE